jgi:hypothetical protein
LKSIYIKVNVQQRRSQLSHSEFLFLKAREGGEREVGPRLEQQHGNSYLERERGWGREREIG